MGWEKQCKEVGLRANTIPFALRCLGFDSESSPVGTNNGQGRHNQVDCVPKCACEVSWFGKMDGSVRLKGKAESRNVCR